MAANPVEAGRKGGRSRSDAKLAACRKNGFQKVKPEDRKQADDKEPTDGQASEAN